MKERHLVNELIENINFYLDIDVKLIIYKDNFKSYFSTEDRFSTSKYNFDHNSALNSISYQEDERDNDEDNENLDYEDDKSFGLGFNNNILRAKTRYNINTKYFNEMNERFQKSSKKNNISECIDVSMTTNQGYTNSETLSDTRCKLVCDVFNSHELFNIMSKSLKIYNNSVIFKSVGQYNDSF